MNKATDKQIKYIVDLAEKYFRNPDKRKSVIAIIRTTEKLTRRDASTIICIMKADVNIQEQAWRMYHRGLCKASFYYANHVDMYDTSGEDTINSIIGKL